MDLTKLDEIPLFAIVLFASTLVGALASLTETGLKFYKFLWKWIKKFWSFLMLAKRVTKLETNLSGINDKLDILVGEVKANGGNSLRDMLTLITIQIFIESESRRKLLDASGLPFWESDANGKCIFASDRLGEIIGLDTKDILQDGWVTNLKDSDKSRVYKEWNYAVEQKRRFIQNYTFVRDDGSEVKVQGHAQPVLHNGKASGFVGILTVL